MSTATSDYLNIPCRSVDEVLRARAERTAVQPIPIPASNRRAFLTRSLAGAAGATIAASVGHAALPGAVDRDPFALACADPLIALGAEQQRIVAKINAPGQVDDVSQAEHAELRAVEEQIEALVPISAAGAIVLVRYLKYRMDGFDWCEVDDQITDNLIAGLRALAAGGVA
jgi:hypothetical protein